MDDGGYFQIAYSRWQGYYGVTSTGVAPPLPIDDIVRIFDGMEYDDGLVDDLDQSFGAGLNIGSDIRKTNILFAEFLLQDPLNNATQTLVIYDDSSSTSSILSIENPATAVQPNFDAALTFTGPSLYHSMEPVVIDQFGINVGPVFDNRYIWILDFVEGDILNGQPNNLTTNNWLGSFNVNTPVTVRARLENSDRADVNSFMSANTHFLSRLPGAGDTYEVNSVRHLNNIRFITDGNYIQIADIDVRSLIAVRPGGIFSENYNFRPIDNLSENSSYNAVFGMQPKWRIDNLIIDTTGNNEFLGADSGVGLFAVVHGDIIGVSLFNAEINAPNATNVGAIAQIVILV
jgi:hypothetical protein